jgi:hypothetical protein
LFTSLITDENDPVTAFAVDWLKAFSVIATSVVVFSTHVGKFDLPTNVKIIELGGGSSWRKFVGSLSIAQRSIYGSKNAWEKNSVSSHVGENSMLYRDQFTKQPI